jgi:hypothetical protein
VHGPIFTRKDVLDFCGVAAARLDSWIKMDLIHFRNKADRGSAPDGWSLYELLQVRIFDVFCGENNIRPESFNMLLPLQPI